MKKTSASTSLLSLLIVLSLTFALFSCGGETASTEQTNDANTEQSAVETPPASPAVDPNAIDESTRAKEACNCFKKLNDMRQAAREKLTQGDSTAFTSVDSELQEVRRTALSCSNRLVDVIRNDEQRKKEFQGVLSRTCPNYSTSILLMTKLNFVPEQPAE